MAALSCLVTFGVEGVISSPSSESQDRTTSAESQNDEFKRFQSKVAKEIQVWETYNHNLNLFMAANKGKHLALQDAAMGAQKEAVEASQNLRFPVRSFTEPSHALTFSQACATHWCDHVGF